MSLYDRVGRSTACCPIKKETGVYVYCENQLSKAAGP